MFYRLSILLIAFLVSVALPACGDGKKVPENPTPPKETARDFKVIHTFVALCDNKSQGIAPMPEKIGSRDDPASNLYWGCTDGSRSYFSKSNNWKRLTVTRADGQPEILERLVFQHKSSRTIMVVDAWQRKEDAKKLRFRAAKAYAKNHKISTKSALNVFAPPALMS